MMIRFSPTKQEFAETPAEYSVAPVYCSLLSDGHTPVSAFECLARDSKRAFLLESVIGGEKIARYSFLGIRPFATVTARDGHTSISTPEGTQGVDGSDPLELLETLLEQYRAPRLSGLPRFLGGAVGYAAYDLARHYEALDSPPEDDRGIPDLHFGVYDEMVVFDHVRKLIHVVVHAPVHGEADASEAYDRACSRILELVEQLLEAPPRAIRPLVAPAPRMHPYESTFTQEAFEQAVDRCQQYIRSGDVFQVVLGQRFTCETEVEPFEIYRALRVINPSPFMFYLQSPETILVGASPEILCRIEGRTVSTRPLAGTRPRGQTESEDFGLEAELLADPKERAEHVMLVDLGRNDLGRVCEAGTVSVDDLMSVERYSHVMHLCSNVSGRLASGKTAFDAVRSVHPVGTVSGAPKIRAMQIIDELEPVRRGPYAGTVGYVDFAGNMDTCIALRTLVITPGADGKRRVDVQVGAGIVVDSDPRGEYQETLNKAAAMFSALTLADSWRAEPHAPE